MNLYKNYNQNLIPYIVNKKEGKSLSHVTIINIVMCFMQPPAKKWRLMIQILKKSSSFEMDQLSRMCKCVRLGEMRASFVKILVCGWLISPSTMKWRNSGQIGNPLPNTLTLTFWLLGTRQRSGEYFSLSAEKNNEEAWDGQTTADRQTDYRSTLRSKLNGISACSILRTFDDEMKRGRQRRDQQSSIRRLVNGKIQ